VKALNKDSAAQPEEPAEAAAAGAGAQTLDSWAWIERARAAARRAVDPSAPAAGAPGERAAETPHSPAD